MKSHVLEFICKIEQLTLIFMQFWSFKQEPGGFFNASSGVLKIRQ